MSPKMSLKMSPKVSIKKLLNENGLKTEKNYANNLKHRRIKNNPINIACNYVCSSVCSFIFKTKSANRKNTTVRDKCPPSVPQMSPKVSLNNTFYTDMTNI